MLSGVGNPIGVRRARRSLMLLALAFAFAFAAAVAFDGGGARAATSLAPGAGAQVAITYATQSGQAPPTVWVMRADGSQKTKLGVGFAPLIAPGGQQVAASLFGTGEHETGPALTIYSTAGAAPLGFFDLAHETVDPLAWSPDGRYLAVDLQSTSLKHTAKLSGLGIVDMQTGTAQVIAHGQLYGVSFAPNGSDEVVYGLSASQLFTARVDLRRSKADGSGTVALTHDGRSLFPIWGPGAIAYDREHLRRNDAPVYQIWLRSPTGSRARRLTNIRVRTLVSGLVPLAFSSDGRRLLTQFQGQDTSEAWTVLLPGGRARRLTVGGRSVQAAALSADGRTVLINGGGFLGPASEGRVATVPFAGGRQTVLAPHGSQASWNG